jgi:CheY-like chemotaxis protein
LHDFDKAHAVYSALLSLFIAEPGGASHPEVLARVSSLCDAAVDAVNDVECRIAIRGVKSLATLLYSDEGHTDVRLQIFNALSNFRARVTSLERRAPSRPEVAALVPKKSLRVLVVEDNRDSAQTLAKLLEICGYDVSIAYTARDGLETAERVRPDVILCDIGLPDSDGFALAEALHENPATASARLIAVTAYGKDHDLERSRRAGFELHLVKPVNPGELLHVLDAPGAAAAQGAA